MSPRAWHIIHVVSFFIALLGLGSTLAGAAGFLPAEWKMVSFAFLVVTIGVHYGSSPRRSWVFPRREDPV